MEHEKYIESVTEENIGGRQIMVTQIRPVLTPEELLKEQVRIKKMLINVIGNKYKTKEADTQDE